MAKLYLVRHGKTVWSGTGRYQGFSDIPLSDDGLAEAGQLARRLAAEDFAAIYCSDLARACQTAEAVAASERKEIARRPDLRELNFGHCEGLTFEQISERFPEANAIWRGADCDNPFPGGESLRQLAQRTGLFLHETKHWETGKKILVVGHCGSLAVIICLLLDIGIEHWWQFRTANSSISIVETFENGTGVLSLLNDVHHLEDAA